jgi:ABC-type multidrug transport system ATPase subunit
LIVDEPTVGLDPTERARFRSLLGALAADRIVVLSTHIVPDVEATASDVALLDDGELLAHTTPADLLNRVDGRVWEVVVPEAELATVKRDYTVAGTTRRSDGVHLRVVSGDRPMDDATPVEPTLEEAYLYEIETDRTAVSPEVTP